VLRSVWARDGVVQRAGVSAQRPLVQFNGRGRVIASRCVKAQRLRPAGAGLTGVRPDPRAQGFVGATARSTRRPATTAVAGQVAEMVILAEQRGLRSLNDHRCIRSLWDHLVPCLALVAHFEPYRPIRRIVVRKPIKAESVFNMFDWISCTRTNNSTRSGTTAILIQFFMRSARLARRSLGESGTNSFRKNPQQ
jgi:hypothetical protein